MGQEESLSQHLIAPRTPSAKFPALGSDQAAVPHVCTFDERGQGSQDDTIRLHLGLESEQAFPRESLQGTTQQQPHATSKVVPKDHQALKSVTHPPQGDDQHLTEVFEGPSRSITVVYTGLESCSKFPCKPEASTHVHSLQFSSEGTTGASDSTQLSEVGNHGEAVNKNALETPQEIPHTELLPDGLEDGENLWTFK